MKTTVLLADDHPSLLEAAAAILQPHFDVVGTATNGAMLVSEARRLRPDIIVTDINMPVLNGIEAVGQLRGSDVSAEFVFLTIYANEEFLKACRAEGALGYVLKSQMNTHLVPAIHAAIKGESYVSPLVAW